MPPRDRKAFDARRRADKPWRAWYTTPRWQAVRKHQLLVQPLCERCLAAKPQRMTIATVVHHLTPHRGNETKFWSGPFASSCKPCHDRIEQGVEARGYDDTAMDVDGFPSDPRHPFNR